MRRIATKWALICVASGALIAGLALVAVSHSKPHAPKFTLAYSTTCGTTDTGFCIAGPAAGSGPTLYPGITDQPLHLNFSNYFGSPISITQITVTFTNPFPSGCNPTAFHVDDTPISGSTYSTTINLPTGFTVGAAVGGTPTQAEYDDMLSLSMADLKTSNQDACEGLPLVMSYAATATSTNVSCLAKQANGALTIPSGEDFCITAGGTQNGNVTVQNGGRLDILGGAVNGGVTVQSGGSLNVQGGSVNGSVSATGASLFSICGASFNGNMSAASSSDFALIGDSGQSGSGCAANTIKGGVTLTGNTAGFELGGNTITGTVTVTGNTDPSAAAPPGTDGDAEIEHNSITGGLSCSNNTPPPSDAGPGGGPNSVNGSRSGQCATPANF
jgi:hypothetical protein